MSRTEVQDVEAVGKYQRSVRLTQDMAVRLHAVCEHLGVNVGAYLTQKIGEAVSKDEVSLLAKQSKDGSMDILARLFEQLTTAEPDEPAIPPKAKAARRGKA